ncbi:hypothetical protein Ddye_000921 [Dipteronia dyeriana]|uniref:HMA domain-containing protein n=1 Tax=Dipteronia dyeriana TaxID=168575 RepID=A0AAD9XN06_9ROSI|nr:hypothetical protein Ddye_000921 [Dipteronia dyeriana]
MGEEEKKPAAAEEKKMEEEKKPEEAKKVEEEKKQETKPAEEKKKEAPEESKEAKETKEEPAPPPTPPQEIILKVYMHCEGCARKVRRCLKGFPGVEDVMTDCKTHKVVVKGEKADPLKVLERVQRKSHRQVELLCPIPKPLSEEEKKLEEKETPKPEEKKEVPQVITVVLKVHMHCEACAQEIKKRILRMKGVESAESDLKSSEVTVKGVFDPPKLVEYVYKRTGKHGVIVKQEPEKKEEKAEEANKEEQKKGSEEGGEKEKEKEKEKKEGGGEVAKPSAEAATEEAKVVELKINEYYHNPSYGIAMEMNPYPYPPQPQMWSPYPPQMLGPYAPQMFSDENPNACSVM